MTHFLHSGHVTAAGIALGLLAGLAVAVGRGVPCAHLPADRPSELVA